MMADKKENRQIIYEDELRDRLLQGAKFTYDAVSTTYGIKGRNVLLERGFGRPTFTRDGTTIADQVFFADRVVNMGSQILAEASHTANLVSGDGSSATVILGYHTFNNAVLAVKAGQHPMDVSDSISRDAIALQARLHELVIPVKDEQLKDVATVSAGDPLVGELIADAILYVGKDGGILTEKAPITEIEREYIDGYYLQSGFTALQAGKKELLNPYVVVSSKRMSSAADAIDLLNAVVEIQNIGQNQIPRILFVGNFEDAAYTTIVNTINAGRIDAIIVPTPPMYGEFGKYLLSDIALYAQCELVTENITMREFASGAYIGTVDKVIASKTEATIFADNETSNIRKRVADIKSQIETEEAPAIAEKLRDRVAKLEGKIAVFKIGGVNDSVREETEYRIEDAINSTRHAYISGVVAGGGVTWLELSKLEGISDITRDALRSTFQQLLINANLPAELKLDEALKAKAGMGYNLRDNDTLVNVVKAGVIDPYIVAREVVANATGAAANAIKTGLAVVFTDNEKD